MKSVLLIDGNNNVIQQYNIEDGQTQEITLVGNRSKSGNTFTFEDGFYGTDIFYVDGYGKDQQLKTYTDLYLNGNLSTGYTGTQYLTFIDDNCGIFNGYSPTFDFTGSIISIDTGNVFNNFAENSLKFTLSNIPSYIQYVIIIMLLFFILGFIRKFKRK